MYLFSELYDSLLGSDRKSLRNKVVLITGASSGIGRQLATDLYKSGSKVILASRSLELLQLLRDELIDIGKLDNSSEYIDPEIVSLDLEKIETLKDKYNEALAIFGHIDILINNAGLSNRGDCLETEIEVYTRLMTINYLGVVELTRHTCQQMVERGSGHVVFISSVQGLIPIPYRGAYSGSKHAIQAWAESLRAELSDKGVSVTTVCPGYVNTNLSRNALTGSGDKHGVLDSTTKSGYSVEYVSDRIISGMVNNDQQLVLAPLYVRLAILIRTLLPSLYRFIMNRRALKEKKCQ